MGAQKVECLLCRVIKETLSDQLPFNLRPDGSMLATQIPGRVLQAKGQAAAKAQGRRTPGMLQRQENCLSWSEEAGGR